MLFKRVPSRPESLVFIPAKNCKQLVPLINITSTKAGELNSEMSCHSVREKSESMESFGLDGSRLRTVAVYVTISRWLLPRKEIFLAVTMQHSDSLSLCW